MRRTRRTRRFIDKMRRRASQSKMEDEDEEQEQEQEQEQDQEQEQEQEQEQGFICYQKRTGRVGSGDKLDSGRLH